MSRSRSRLAADWFALLRENLTTGGVEHQDVAAVTETVSTTVASDIAAVQSDITAVQNTVTTSVAADIAAVQAEIAAVQTAVSTSVAADIAAVQSEIDTIGDVTLQNWAIEEVGGELYFKVSGVTKAKLDASGNLTAVSDITAYGTV